MSKVVKAVGNAVSGVVKAVTGVVSGVVGAIGKVVSGVLNFVITPFLGLFGLGAPSLPEVSSPDNIKGVLVQKSGSDSPIPIVYGYRKIAGTVVFAETGADSNKYLWVAYALCEGLVEGLREVWIDNVQIPAVNMDILNKGGVITVSGKNTDSKTGSTSDCKFNKFTQLQFYTGSYYTDPATTEVGTRVGAGIFAGSPSWTTNMNYNGVAVLFARYEWPTDTTNNPFSGNIPQVQVCMLGRRVAGLTSGSPESYEYGVGNYSEAYSYNPAEILLDYLRNPRYGKGLKNAEIDWPSFKRVAAKCNQQVEYVAGVRGPIHQLNIVVPTSNTIFNNTKEILSNFRSYLPYVNGKYKLVIEDAGNPTDIMSGTALIAATFNKDNIQGDITYTGIERSSKYNAVKYNYCDPDKNWAVESIFWPESYEERVAYQAIDGGRENVFEATLGGVTNYSMVKDLARLTFNKSRYQDSLSLTVSSQGFDLEPGDNVYIDANILKFGTDPEADAIPWRIISIKLNNDYTFDLGLVRNEDRLYPRTRVGEIDYQIALYVPQGATRFYPAEPVGIPIGLNPPSSAPRSTLTPTNPIILPPATVPSVPTVPPRNSGFVNPLNDTISITKIIGNGLPTQANAVLTWIQPKNTSYSGVTLYWKRNTSVETVYSKLQVNDKPGTDLEISAQIGPLIAGQSYKVIALVMYQTGEISTLTSEITFQATAQGSALGISNSTGLGTSPGWSLPTTPIANAADATFSSLVAVTRPDAGSPRSLAVTFKQDINTYGSNRYVKAIRVYFKPSVDQFWKEQVYQLTGDYVPGGSEPTFNITGLGNKTQPTIPTDAQQRYDFIFRFEYTDNKPSLFQWRVMNARTEYSGTAFTAFNSFATSPNVSNVTVVGTESTNAYVPSLASSQPVGTLLNDFRNITIGLYRAQTSGQGAGGLRFFYNPPATVNQPYWYGVRVYFRRIVVGQNPGFSRVDSMPGYRSSSNEWSVPIAGLDYTQSYQYVIVPMVDYQGARVEGSNCWMGQGQVNADFFGKNYPSDNNFFSRLGFREMPTADALLKIRSTFALTNPVVNFVNGTTTPGFRRVQVVAGSTASSGYYYDVQLIPPAVGLLEVIIYRRSCGMRTGATNVAAYFPDGRWEKIVLTPTSAGVIRHGDGSGRWQFNLRAPTSGLEFDPAFGIVPGATLLANTGFAPTLETNPAATFQYFFVLKTGTGSGTISTDGVVVQINNALSRIETYDVFSTWNPEVFPLENFNDYEAGYQRNISEARNATDITFWAKPVATFNGINPNDTK